MKSSSTLEEVCALFGCAHIDELDAMYLAHDQTLMRNREWDYQNESLLINRIRARLEALDMGALADDYDRWRVKEILWLWYHHAISCALWRYGDESAAREFATKAVEYHQKDNPNKITQLLFLLVHRRIQEAKECAAGIDSKEEIEMAEHLLTLYANGLLFAPQI